MNWDMIANISTALFLVVWGIPTIGAILFAGVAWVLFLMYRLGMRYLDADE